MQILPKLLDAFVVCFPLHSIANTRYVTVVAVDEPEVTFNGTEVVLVQLVAPFAADVLGSGSGEEDNDCVAACRTTTTTAATAATVTAQTEASITGTTISIVATASSSQVRR